MSLSRAIQMVSVAAVGLRTKMFDAELGADAVGAQYRVFARAVARLRDIAEVVAEFCIDDANSAAQVALGLALQDPAATIVAIMMSAAAPSAAGAIPAGRTIVIWDPSSGQSIATSADQVAAHRETGSIGAVMLGSSLAVRPRVVSLPVEAVDLGPLASALSQARSAIRVARVGAPPAGYSGFGTAEAAALGIGVEVVDIDVDRVAQDLNQVTQATDSESTRSQALARVLAELAEEVQADAVTVNCHGPAFRGNEEIGIVACLAASSGLPTSCTADVPTAWLLAVATRIAGAALYCEPYSVDDPLDAVLFGNCGIGNESMACPGTWRELPSQFYPGCAGAGLSVGMTVRPGAATFVSVATSSRQWALSCTEGEVVDARLPSFGGAHAYFQPASGSPRTWIARQAMRASSHHGALMLGHRVAELRDLAAELGVEILLA